MAQVDASRFLAHLARLFAPNIIDGQEFFAYIGEDNSFSVQADNIIQASGKSSAVIDTAEIEALSSQISALKSQADSLEDTCSNIPPLLAQIQTLSGSTDGEANIDFNYASLSAQFLEFRSRVENSIFDLQEEFSRVKKQVYDALYPD